MNSQDGQTEALYRIFLKHPRISTDSRNIQEDSIFFALKGNNFDGNKFAAEALRKGAVYAVVDDLKAAAKQAAEYGEEYDGAKLIVVDDVLESLQSLAAHHRKVLAIPIIAITGTNGKTTTKELITAVLFRNFHVSATRGNLNNHIGVPLTLLSFTRLTEIGVVEMGASGRGEIARLCEIAQPDYGIITNIGRAHLSGFGGIGNVRAAKGELFDYLSSSGGTAIVNGDDKTLTEMAGERSRMKCIMYQSSSAAGFESALIGEYNLQNIAAAIAVGRIFGIPLGDMRYAIKHYKPSNLRSQLIDSGRNLIIADCYNANPSSMRAAIGNFLKERRNGQNGEPLKKIMILGDMLELGEWSAEDHREIAALALGGDADAVWFVGPAFSDAVAGLGVADSGTPWLVFADADKLVEFLSLGIVENNLFLVKGSNSIKLDKVVEML